MKTLITRVRNLLVLLLCAAPLLIWAIAPSIQGLSVTAVPQLKFAQAQIQRLATNLTPFTQTATSPYSKGAISYSSTQPGVASVNASTGEVTPRSVGETIIVATQAAAAPFPAATARYTVQLTGEAPVFDSWTLGSKTYFPGAAYVIGVDLPAAQARNSTGSVISGTITYRLKDPATMAAIATVATNNNVTTVRPLTTGTIVLVAEQAATAQFAAASTEATLTISALPAMNQVTLPYGANLTLTAQATGVTSPVTSYRVANNAIATIPPGGQTINTVSAGSTTLFAVLNGVDVASGSLTVTKGTPTLTNFSAMTKTVNNEPFDLDAKSADLVTGLARNATVRYAVTTSSNPQAVTLLGNRGQTAWIAQGGTVQITATQDADNNHLEARATATLTIGGAELPWVKITQPLPSTVLLNQDYTIKVLTNSPMRLALGMKNRSTGMWLDRPSPYWEDLSVSSPRGPNIEDVYVVNFRNGDATDMLLQSLLAPPVETWNYAGFVTPLPYPTEWTLGNTTLSRVLAGPDVPFPGRITPYTFTFGTTPSAADAAIPPEVGVDSSSVQTSITELASDNPTSPNQTYYLKPVGVGSYTLKGTVLTGANAGSRTSILVTVSPAATTLSGLQPITLTTDSRRVEIFPPQSSRPGTPSFTYQIAASGSAIARLVSESGRYYVEPAGTPGTTTITVTQAAAGNYAEGTTSASITVNAGAPPITVFLANITRTYGDVDVLVPLPEVGFTPDQTLGGTITFTSTNPSVASTVMDSGTGKIRIGFTHAGTTTLTVKQGTSTATTTITVNKGTPSLQYIGGTMALQQGMCSLNPDLVRMPLLNAGPTGTNELHSTSDGTVTYSITATNLMTFGTRLGFPTPYNEGYLYGVQPNNYANVAGDLYSLRVDQAETADYLGATLTVPNAFLIKGRSDGPFNCGA